MSEKCGLLDGFYNSVSADDIPDACRQCLNKLVDESLSPNIMDASLPLAEVTETLTKRPFGLRGYTRRENYFEEGGMPKAGIGIAAVFICQESMPFKAGVHYTRVHKFTETIG